MTSPTYDPLNREVQQNPYPHYVDLRNNHPALWIDSLQAYVVSRYDDVKEVLSNKEKYTSENFWDALVGEFNPVPDAIWLISVDGPDHLRLRRLANKAFAPSQFSRIKSSIENIVEALLDDCVASGDIFDFSRDFAWLYPANVVADILGVDPARRADFKLWVDQLLNAANRERMTDAERKLCRDTTNTMTAYFEAVIAERRKNPGDDLISSLIRAEDDGNVMSMNEVLANTILLLTGGVETTSNLTGSMMTILSEHPQVYKDLKADIGLLPQFIEESLRYSPPVQILFRDALVDSEIDGTLIPAGAKILIVTGAANRDESVFTNPETFDMYRSKEELSQIISFGAGVHFCLGAQLARFEATIAMKAILKRFSHLEVLNPDYQWIDSYFARGPESLLVKYSLAQPQAQTEAEAEVIAKADQAKIELADKHSGDFVVVAKVSDIAPGKIKGVDIDARKFIICNLEGQYFALDGLCSHAGGPLCRGELDGRVVVCPWHGWEFDVETGACDVEPTLRQKTYALKISGDDIMVNIGLSK